MIEGTGYWYLPVKAFLTLNNIISLIRILFNGDRIPNSGNSSFLYSFFFLNLFLSLLNVCKTQAGAGATEERGGRGPGQGAKEEQPGGQVPSTLTLLLMR